MKQVLVNHKL